MLADIQETTSDAIRTVVTGGPEKLDGVTYAAGMTAVAAGGAAMIAGPTPDDAIHLTVAGIAATTATLSNTAATVLSVIDAAVYGSNEAKLRLTTTLTTFLVGRYVASRAHQPATQTLQNATRAEGATKATSVASGAAAGAAAEKVLEERAEDEGN